MYFIYLIADNTGAYKIGYGKDVEARKKQHQTSNARKLEIVLFQSFDVSENDVRNIERDLHRRYLHLQTEAGNEWFYLGEKEVADFLHLLQNPKKIPLSVEETYRIILNLRERKNKHYDNEKLREVYYKKNIRKRCLETFGMEFFVDSLKKSLDLDKFAHQLPPPPFDFDGKIVGKQIFGQKILT